MESLHYPLLPVGEGGGNSGTCTCTPAIAGAPPGADLDMMCASCNGG